MFNAEQKKEIVVAWIVAVIMNSNAIAQDVFKAPYDVGYEKLIAQQMDEGIDAFLDKYTAEVIDQRSTYWDRQFESDRSYKVSVEPNREHLRQWIGLVDERPPVQLVTLSTPDHENWVAETNSCKVYRVEWTVLEGLQAEGLLLMPRKEVKGSVVIIPDADELPEAYAGMEKGTGLALRLAESGIQVMIPALVNRDSRYSGGNHLIPINHWPYGRGLVSAWTNLPHREWIHRQGYVLGRNIIGLEVQKVLAAVDWMESRQQFGKIGVMGYGEGGLLAFYAAALDDRIDATWVSGYFGPRNELWSEPIYRNVWGLLTEFGDAEIASLIVPRSLVIEAAPVPDVDGPPPAERGQRPVALPGRLGTPSSTDVRREIDRLKGFFPETSAVRPDVILISDTDRHGTDEALSAFTDRLRGSAASYIKHPIRDIKIRNTFDPQRRQERVFRNMEEFLQDMVWKAEQVRYAFLEGDYSSPESWDHSMEVYRKIFYDELVGRIDEPMLPMNPRLRQIYDETGWKGYEVVLDVWPGVFAWGILAVPKDIKPGETRPVVVVQHGGDGGGPTTPISAASYNNLLPALVNRGFVVFSPRNPYEFNIRKANAVKASMFSVIIPQHKQILRFLDSLDYVDGTRIAMYGKSLGGRTAQTVPVVLKKYRAAITSAYFNWFPKIVSTDHRNSFFFFNNTTGIYRWNLGNTFAHAEMASLVAPRPFMVERGYRDEIASNEAVGYEFAKVRRLYDRMGIGDRAEIEYFTGGHEINGVGTFRFLHRHLDWPEPKGSIDTQ